MKRRLAFHDVSRSGWRKIEQRVLARCKLTETLRRSRAGVATPLPR